MPDRTARPPTFTLSSRFASPPAFSRRRGSLRGAIERLEARTLMSATTVFHEAFEGDFLTGWTNRTDQGANPDTRWGLNTVRAARGAQSAFASALVGGVSTTSGYRNDQRNRLLRENVSLAGFTVATLAFDYFLNSESGYDTFSVAVADGAGARTTLFSESGNFSSAGWRHRTLDLSAFTGRRDLDIEFRFVSDASVTHEGGGVWIDEAMLTADTAVAPAAVSGRLFDDVNGNGARDAGEGPLAGWVVFLDRNRNGVRDAGELSRTTDAAGNYAFNDLTPGTYHIAQETPAGYAQTSPGLRGASSGSSFDIDVVFPDTTLTTSQRAAFIDAASRWAQVIVGDVPDASDDGRVIDDIRIVATAPAIDGRGGVLGRAAPDGFRNGSNLPYKGFMEFDAADLARLEADGQLARVVLHEMGHVLGFGTIWGAKGLVRGAGGSDPRFLGTNATREYNAIFGTNVGSVPLEPTGGPGTADSHWRDTTFGRELMTGFLNAGANPISRVTLGAMADIGYRVSYSAADAYARPGSMTSAAGATAAGERTLLAYAHTVFVDAGQVRAGLDFGNRRSNRAPVVGAVTASPAAGAVGAILTLTAVGVGDADGSVTKVSFYRESNGTAGLQSGAGGDTLVGSDSTSADGFKAAISTAGLAAGAYAYYAQATDDGGARSAGAAAAPSAAHTVRAAAPGPTPAGRIAGVVFNDVNGNGVRNAGEPAQAGWRVFLDANRNGGFDAGERSVVTGSTGAYEFTDLAAGTYHVRTVDQPSWTRSAAAPVIKLAAGATASGRDHANFRSATLRGNVFVDADRDGEQDVGEAGLAGVRVFDDKNNNGRFDAGERNTTTDAGGNYTLRNLGPGTRTPRIVVAAGRRLASPSVGYHRVVPLSGQTVTGLNFGVTSLTAAR
jgi:hypothetical protein